MSQNVEDVRPDWLIHYQQQIEESKRENFECIPERKWTDEGWFLQGNARQCWLEFDDLVSITIGDT